MRACLAAGVIALAGCEPGAAPRRLKVVHVAWPGRAASDAMERELYAEPRFRAWRASADFERTTVDEADAGLRGLLRGCGTVVRADGEVIAVLRGAALPSRWLDFVRRAARHREPTRTAPAAAWLEHARSAIELGRPERALEIVERLGDRAAAEQRTALRVAAHLATGEVAAARRALDEAPPAARPAVALARVLLAERRAADAIAALGGPAASPADEASAVVLGRALLDCGDRARAYPLLTRVAQGGGRCALEAAELLAGAFAGHGHSHR